MRYKKHVPWLFLLPTILGLIIFRLGPIIAVFFVSLTRWRIFSPPEWVGLGNYLHMFNSDIFWRVFRNTLIFSGIFIPGVMIFGLALALLINRKMRGITFFRGLFYLPVVSSTVAVAVVWSWMLSPRFGIIQSVLNSLTGLNMPNFLGRESLVIFALVGVYIWKMAGYYMIIFLAGLQNIPPVYYEAALVDGGSRWQMFKHITLPLLSPTTFFVLIISLIMSLKTFDITFAMTQGGPNYASSTLIFHIYTNGFMHFRMGYASALATILFVIVAVVSYINFKAKKHWVTADKL